jgi:hypothetical protein
MKETAEKTEKVFALGLPLSKDNLYETFQIAKPVDDNDVLVKSEPQPVQEKESKEDGRDKKTSEFAEKKTLETDISNKISADKSNWKTERFHRLRPSMIRFSDE